MFKVTQWSAVGLGSTLRSGSLPEPKGSKSLRDLSVLLPLLLPLLPSPDIATGHPRKAERLSSLGFVTSM